jgi:putative hydrolase
VAIRELLDTGRWSLLARLRGEVAPEALFQTIPGIGPDLAERIHDQLHVDTLEALEVALHDGRLEEVRGIGPRRAAGIRATLSSMLGQSPRRLVGSKRPPVDLLLEVDHRYREAAAAGELPTISPRRFNPEGQAWLPILHTECGGWHFTALFSNTARAHRLGRTGDWVVLYFYDDHHLEGQSTIVTETRGGLVGRRVVRGQEQETARVYAGEPVPG